METWELLLSNMRDEFLLREDELQLLHEIDLRLLESERPLNATFNFIVTRTQHLLQSDATNILLRRGRRFETAYSGDESLVGQEVDIRESLTGEALLSGKTVNVGDVTVQPHAGKYVQVQGYYGPPLRSLLATPIRVRDTMIGVLSVESSRPNAFKAAHERIISGIASQVAIALQRAQAFDQNKLFSQVDALMFRPEDSHQVISAALQKVIDALHELEHVELDQARILFRQDEDHLEVAHSTNSSEVGLVLDVNGSICGRAIRELRTVVVGDVSVESRPSRLVGPLTGSEIAIPIAIGNSDVTIGVLNVESEEPDAFEGFCQILLENFSDKVRTLLAFAKLRSDVTEVLELRNANDLLVAVGDQASHIVHTVNNTVGAMRLRVIELQNLHDSDRGLDDQVLTEFLSALRRLADRTLQMPEDISRLLNQHGVEVDVNLVTRTALEKFELPINVALEVDLEPSLPRLALYSFDIVVQNLIQNALDAMPDGGTLSVSTLLASGKEAGSGYVQLTVGDTGTGIAKEVLPRIFDLNFTTKTFRGKGHGLGLWWIRNFVLRAKGHISVDSALGRGSEFVVKFPTSKTVEKRKSA